MLEQKHIIPVTIPIEWYSPNVIIPKADGPIRICVDLTELNKKVQLQSFYQQPAAQVVLRNSLQKFMTDLMVHKHG